MIFRNATTRARIAVVILIPFLWLSCGGEAWAASCRAAEDPASTLRRLADDPRRSLTPAEREHLRQVADRMETQPRPAALRGRGNGPHAERVAVAEMQRMAEEIERYLEAGSESVGQKMRAGRAPEPPAQVKGRFEAAHRSILDGFAATEARLRAAGSTGEILKRHEAARAAYEAHARVVLEDLATAEQSRKPGDARRAWAAAAERLRRSHDARPRQSLDLAHMPFRRAEPTSRSPGNVSELRGESLWVFSPAEAAEAVQPPTPADLAETEDVELTPEIRVLAAELGHHPVEIFNWVYDHVEPVPSYGSIQGAATTLTARRGNAFDTASLLVALLRASGIPARHVTGTVDLAVDRLPGWLGVSRASTAQQLLSQGGVPNVGVLRGGEVTHVRLDHVWVEAWIDYLPGRGAGDGEGDTWVALDPSFKLHEVQEPSDYFRDVPFDVLDPAAPPFVVDESLGRVTDVDDEALDQRLAQWAEESDTYFLTHDVEENLRGILGGKVVVPRTSTVLPSSLPYRVVTRSPGLAALPAGLRHEVRVEVFASATDRAAGEAAVRARLSLPKIGLGRLGIRFEPAAEADAETLALAREEGAESLPVYLVEVVPVVELDGVELARGAALGMGETMLVDVTLDGPDGPSLTSYSVLAGDEIVVGVTGSGVTPEMVEARLAAQPSLGAQEYLHQVQLHYWMEADYLAEIAARSLGVHTVRRPSVGLFSSPLTVASFFGAPGTGVYQSRTMDVKQNVLGAAGDEPVHVTAFLRQAGAQSSYLEGGIFDQLENLEIPFIRGISAMHLLSSAMTQGIPVYRITVDNEAAVLPRLQLDEILIDEIQAALAQGKTVMIPERELDLGTWRGVGYVIQDEATGAGAYLISGGLAGGGLIECIEQLVPVFVEALEMVAAVLLAVILVVLILGAAAGLAPVLAGGAATVTAAGTFAFFLLLVQGMVTTQLAAA